MKGLLNLAEVPEVSSTAADAGATSMPQAGERFHVWYVEVADAGTTTEVAIPQWTVCVRLCLHVCVVLVCLLVHSAPSSSAIAYSSFVRCALPYPISNSMQQYVVHQYMVAVLVHALWVGHCS